MFYTQLFPEGSTVWRKLRKSGVVPQDAGGVTTLFAITGDVVLSVFGICKASLTTSDAITVACGVAGNTAALIASIANATNLIINEIWTDATPTVTLEAMRDNIHKGFTISNGQDCILTPSGTFTAGSIDFYAHWSPLSSDGKVVVA